MSRSTPGGSRNLALGTEVQHDPDDFRKRSRPPSKGAKEHRRSPSKGVTEQRSKGGHRAKEVRRSPSKGGHRAKESPSKGDHRAKEVTEQRRSPNKGVTEQRSKKKTKEQAKEQKLGEKERGNIKFLFRALSSCPGKRVQTSKNVCRRETDELLFSRVLFICFVLHPFQNDLCLFDHKLLLPLKEERHFGRNHVCVCEYY